MKKAMLLVVAALLLVPAIASANVISNSGFEEKGQGSWINYDFGPEFGRDWNNVEEKHDGVQSLKLWTTSKTNDPNKWEMTGAKQIFAVQPGDVINGGAWLKTDNLNGVEAFVECKWLDSDKKELGSGIGTVHKTSGSSDWEYQDLSTWTPEERTAPAGAAYVDFRINLLSPGNSDVATGTVWWDEAQFSIEKGSN